jgi:hypothetical protein
VDTYLAVSQSRLFEDRYTIEKPEVGVDVIVPLLHSTPFWRQNLLSYYREIPIRRLLVGNAGAIDGSDKILNEFPRVEILDHRGIRTLGKSLSELISTVETEFFIYLQSDTFLPPGWFDTMWGFREKFDWVGCPERPLVVLGAPTNDQGGKRPMAGTQFGRTSAFNLVNGRIEDDFGYRQEDFIFEEHVLRSGGRVGGVHDTYHVHQITERLTSGRQLKVRSINVEFEPELDDDRVLATQLKGFVKYCNPRQETVRQAAYQEVAHLVGRKLFSLSEFISFAKLQNPIWRVPIALMYWRARLLQLARMPIFPIYRLLQRILGLG